MPLNLLCLDVENGSKYIHYTDRTNKNKKYLDLSPFNHNNQLVSVGFSKFIENTWSDVEYFCINHSTQPHTENAKQYIQDALDWADVVIGHYVKHDFKWLYECGFKYDKHIWDTGIAEYILQRGIKKPLDLFSLAVEHKLPLKKYDLIQPYLNSEISFYNIPWELIEEYGIGDIITTCALYEVQQIRLESSSHLLPTIYMSNIFLNVLVEMERNGIYINKSALDKVEKEYENRLIELNQSLRERAIKVMGNVHINLNSNDFCSKLFYSREIIDKNIWKEVFNIGTDSRGKPNRPPLMHPSAFNKAIRKHSTLVKIQKAITCQACDGTGYIDKYKKDGTSYKKNPVCKLCNGTGIVYEATNQIAGLRITPTSPYDTSSNGFKADKTTLIKLKDLSKHEFVRTFIDDFIEFNAIKTYLSTFIDGINRYKQGTILRTHFNQTIAATGRLSSSAPNLQNMPRGNTFPVKKAFASRFEGGTIIEADYSGLEFRMAGALSGCSSVRRYIDEGIDPHAFTRDFINSFDPTLPQIDRQDAKPDTFKPLYGGTSGSPRQRAYYKRFLEEHYGVKAWHEELKKEAIKTKLIRLPTGREYKFKYAKRMPNGYVNQTTQIVNYPVQGFATADVVPCGVIGVWRLWKQHNLKSLLILTVHDSLYVDCYPGENDIVVELLKKGLLSINEIFQELYGIPMEYPLAIEIKEGYNAFNMKEIKFKYYET